jgi:hypothetical protein
LKNLFCSEEGVFSNSSGKTVRLHTSGASAHSPCCSWRFSPAVVAAVAVAAAAAAAALGRLAKINLPWRRSRPQGYGELHSLKNLFFKEGVFSNSSGITARLHTAVRLRTALAVAVAVVQLLLQLLLLLLQPLQLPWLLLLFPLAVDKKLLE